MQEKWLASLCVQDLCNLVELVGESATKQGVLHVFPSQHSCEIDFSLGRTLGNPTFPAKPEPNFPMSSGKNKRIVSPKGPSKARYLLAGMVGLYQLLRASGSG